MISKKNILTTALLLCSLFAMAQQEDQYKLKLRVSKLKGNYKVYLVTSYGWTNQALLDSADVRKGRAEFTGTIEEPRAVQLVLVPEQEDIRVYNKKGDALQLYLEKGDISVTGKGNVKQAKVKGGIVNTEYAGFKRSVLSISDSATAQLSAAFPAADAPRRISKGFMDSIMIEAKRIKWIKDSLSMVYVKAHPSSFLSVEALNELAGKDPDPAVIRPIFKTLSPSLQESPTGKKLAARLNATGPTSPGAVAPDFTQNDVNDQPVQLSSFRGKYLLLDFWASWCGPCRAENPTLVKAYDRFKDRDFTILGVSLDQPGKKDAWLAAIEKDGLTWTQVSDLQFWDNAAARLYNVRAVPQNFLIGPDGKILAKNLRGEALIRKLETLFP